jgi:hypothetical protein
MATDRQFMVSIGPEFKYMDKQADILQLLHPSFQNQLLNRQYNSFRIKLVGELQLNNIEMRLGFVRSGTTGGMFHSNISENVKQK